MFLMFMLVQLIAAHQVVLVYTDVCPWLFYQGEVYTRSIESWFKDLPLCKGVKYSPILTLVDSDRRDQAQYMPINSNIWPIQASSP